MTRFLPYLGIILCLIGSGFFSGTEIAYTSLSKIKMKKESENPSSPIWKLISFIYNHYDFALSTVLVGNNLVNIAATSIATVLAVGLAATSGLSDSVASTVVTVVMTIIILIVGEITPKMIARQCTEGFAKMAAYPLTVCLIIFFPVVWLTSVIVKIVSRLFKKQEREVTVTEEELENLLDTAEEEGVLEENDTELLQSALEFADMQASDILTPRIDVVGFEIGDSMEHILSVISETQFSRFPVYEGTVDHVVGILYAKHLLRELVDNPDVSLQDLLLKPVFIPKTMHLPDIMTQFRRNQTHMTVVADEYGGIMGIVTMEDVLEFLVGEIWDENDDIVNEWQELDKGRYECAGEMNLAEFCDHFEMDDEDIDTDCATVGGWATENIGAMPVPFDSFDYKNLTVLVKHVDEHNRITRLLILEHNFSRDEDEEK